MGPGRQAGRADIADDLTAPYILPAVHGDAAHVAITCIDAATVAQLHRIAASASAPCRQHAAIRDCDDRLAVTRLEIEPRMHPAIAEDRMAAHTEARTHATWHGRHQAAALLPDARCLVKLAILAPAHQLDGRLFAPVQARIKQLACLSFARGGTAMRNDEIECISGPDFPVEVHVLAQ